MKTLALGIVGGGIALAALGCGGDGGAGGGFKQGTGGGGGHLASSGTGAGHAGGGPGAGGSGTSTSTSTASGGGTCAMVFPPPESPPSGEEWWNADVSSLPVDPNSDNYVAFINANGGDGPLHGDFDTQGGIPFNLVDNSVAKVPVTFGSPGESDPGPYPIPPNPAIEGGSDRHLLMVQTQECKLYELFAVDDSSGSWVAGSGAIWDLTSKAMRTACWTSADAAGLPIYPGLVRYDEVAAGAIRHALRFTVSRTQRAFITPGRHYASTTTDPNAPPMGLRMRLKSNASVNAVIAAANPQPKIILTALQTYGMLLADNGSNWFVTGAPDPNWDVDGIHTAFGQLHGGDFEAVATGEALELPAMCP
jgi:hypothetical protein